MGKIDNFSNTLFLQGELEKKISTQNQAVLAFFKRYPEESFTPLTVYRMEFERYGIPYTSVRRSITMLTNKGFLFKTGLMEKEMFGANNNLWKLNRQRVNVYSELM